MNKNFENYLKSKNVPFEYDKGNIAVNINGKKISDISLIKEHIEKNMFQNPQTGVRQELLND